MIQVAEPAYLLAAKLEAFWERGVSDILMSHDLDDVVILVDGRRNLVSEVARADVDVRTFVAECIGWLLDNPEFHDTLSSRLSPDAASQARRELILQRMRALASYR